MNLVKVLENISSLFGTVPIPVGIMLFSLLLIIFTASFILDQIEKNKKIKILNEKSLKNIQTRIPNVTNTIEQNNNQQTHDNKNISNNLLVNKNKPLNLNDLHNKLKKLIFIIFQFFI